MIDITKIDDVYLYISSDDTGDLLQIDEEFKFRVSGYRFMPAYKSGRWDGFVHLFNIRDRTIPIGLYNNLVEYCDTNNLEYSEDIKDTFKGPSDFDHSLYPISIKQNIITLYDYQETAIKFIIENNRGIILSPTGSGKSSIIYQLIRYWLDSHEDKILLIVPNLSLVNQMKADILDYSALDDTFNEEDIHIIKGGTNKDGPGRLYIATWQSLGKVLKDPSMTIYWNQFKSVLVDEAHLAKGLTITNIINKLTDCPNKVGLTGTLSADESKTTKLQLQGLFGPIHITTTTRKLIDSGTVADMRIESLLLDYPDELKQDCKRLTYQQEIDWIVMNPNRNYFISKLASVQKGNTIVLFNFIKQGEDLFTRISEMAPDRQVYYISGEVKGDIREEIRNAIEGHDDAIIVGNISVIGTGISINKLHSMILAHPTKSRIRTIQAIGRLLRKHETKDKAIVYDLADDLSWKKHKNYGLNHYQLRVKYYNQEKLDYTVKRIKI